MTTELLQDLESLLSQKPNDSRAVYDRAAPRYDHFRVLWLKLAGGEAEEKMLEGLSRILHPGMRVLDAGSGTGAVSREMLEIAPALKLTLVDQSLPMLQGAVEIPGYRVAGDVLALPLASDIFDVVVSAWVIETVSDPRSAVAEYLRVLSPTGYLFYSFCSLPEGWLSRAASAWLRKTVEKGFAGRFLPPEEIPWHDCGRSRRWRFHGGLTTLVVLRKCCTVGPDVLPVPMEAVPATEV